MCRQRSLFDTLSENEAGIKVGTVREITYHEARDFILPKHYVGRMPSITIAYGWFIDGELVAACTFGKPASPFVCESICGKKWSGNVYELNRLVRIDNLTEYLSQFVSYCLRLLKQNDWIIVSYSDMGMCHHGYIYQSCNFIYTGCTKERTDRSIGGQTRKACYSRYRNKTDQNTKTQVCLLLHERQEIKKSLV